MELQVIARARNGFKEKFGIPRQSGRADAVLTRIVFEKPYRVEEALRGIEQWSHLWLIWGFSANFPTKVTEFPTKDKTFDTGGATFTAENKLSWQPTVRPPRLGGNKRVGVFATRSPFRPNGLGLSSVRLLRVEKTAQEGMVLIVSGADLMDGTPIYDIKPYLPYTDCHTDATAGFAGDTTNYKVQVRFAEAVLQGLDEATKTELEQLLSENPIPQYQHDKERVYGMRYKNYDVHFQVDDGVIDVIKVKLDDE